MDGDFLMCIWGAVIRKHKNSTVDVTILMKTQNQHQV